MPNDDFLSEIWLRWNGVQQLAQQTNTSSYPRWLAWQCGDMLVVGPRIGGSGGACMACLFRRLASQGRSDPKMLPKSITLDRLREGVQCLRQSASDNFDMLSWQADQGWVTHRLLSVPGCPCAGRMSDAGGMRTAISSLVGIVSGLLSWDEPFLQANVQTVITVANGCDARALGSVSGELTGVACGAASQASMAAVGEVLERYCAGFMPPGLVVCRAKELGQAHLSPSPSAFAGEAVGDDTAVRWVQGTRLVNHEPCWVPAASVYFPYVCDDVEPRRSTGSSEGLAAGSSWEAAVEHAAFELIERDSFMRCWRYNGRRWSLPNPFPMRDDLRFTLIDNRFGVPVVAAFSECSEVPYCVSGLAARATLVEAIEASAREAIGARGFFKRVTRDLQRRALESRYRHAVDPALGESRRNWLTAPPAHRESVQQLAWKSFVQRVPDAVAVDVTTPDAFSVGIRVARVVIPGCHGFEPVPGMSRLGGNPQPIPY